jgi:hypothetical protein
LAAILFHKSAKITQKACPNSTDSAVEKFGRKIHQKIIMAAALFNSDVRGNTLTKLGGKSGGITHGFNPTTYRKTN